MASSQPFASQVRVGVRIRPLTHQEVGQGGKMVLTTRGPEIQLGQRRFTYDAVFHAAIEQSSLYAQVSAPLQASFLDGYNATIMAYGQTGSGKTFTMGSEAHTELELCESTGLIPRFMNDLFEQLQAKQETAGLCSYQLEASFLEVYGEDVHDLLDSSRTPLPLREDANGGIVCAGLTHRKVETAGQALQVLHEGTLNRTTAATLMNLTSSRSHAVFTVTLTQVSKESSGVQVTTTSRFTFVDLAGSERMKKTGAEGERAREGIKINEGLLALGNVINALADEERLAEGKKIHVPYRQSKLTRLLQDALGGNSQTLFLACVSPSDTNASETLSTLHYANRARNIKNAPTKNVDASLLELQRLQAYNNVLQAELVRHKFGGAAGVEDVVEGKVSDELMMRPDVNDYLGRLHVLAQESTGLSAQPLTLACGPPLSPSAKAVVLTSPRMQPMNADTTPNRSVIEQYDPSLLSEVNPDEEMAILNHLLELQQKDQDFDAEKKKDVAELKQMEGELAEQEGMLLQLRESLKVYHNMKAKYEKLMAEVQHLEMEKAQLADKLEKATVDPTQGCSTAIKKELEKVERNLTRARNETRKHRQMYRKAEQEAQKCRVLERKVANLKTGKANLIKKQKESAARHREYTETKTREIAKLKKRERVAEQKMSKLQTEIHMHKKNLDKRQQYCQKLSQKLKQTETHLMKLLSMRRRELRDHTGGSSRRLIAKPPVAMSNQESTFAPEESEEMKSLQFVLDKAITDRVNHEDVKQQYEDRVNEYTEAMRSIVDAVERMETRQDSPSSINSDLEHEIEEKELKVELLASELDSLRSQLVATDKNGGIDQMESVKKLVANKEAPILRTLFLGVVGKATEAELDRKKMSLAVERKDTVINSFEKEVEALSSRVESLTHDIARRHSLFEAGVDPAEKILSLEKENSKLKSDLDTVEQQLGVLKDREKLSAKEHNLLQTELARVKEQASLIQVALQQSDGVEPPEGIMRELQSNWEKLGVSIEIRDEARRQIENCLSDTCERKLHESAEQIAITESKILELDREIQVMCQSLEDFPAGTVDEASSLLERLEALNLQKKQLEPKFNSAVARRNALADKVRSLSAAMGMTNFDSLDADLRTLLEEAARTDDLLQTASMLSDYFLSRCESQVSSMRLEKSKILANSSNLQKKTFALVSEMNLAEEEIYPIVVHSIHQRSAGTLPSWWQEELAQVVTRAVAIEGGVVRSTVLFAQHLNAFHESLQSVSQSRRLLSTKLRDLVTRAQKTLLETVDGEVDAAEAYSSFHDALFRLPLLSKEHIHACVSEMDALTAGIEAMMQSEIEALTVVWEALNVSTEARGLFWETIEESLMTMQSNPEGPFHDVLQSSSVDSEEWVLVTVKEATHTFKQLENRLFKLEKIHEEVEKMSARQDTKSRIISLDSEIRILSAKLSEFEDQKCGKERLVTKKTTSSNLLREEHFRKQMQSKFSSRLEQLAKLLKTWRRDEGEAIDSNLLSDEVRSLLSNFDDMDSLVEKRTKFMHLRTVRPRGSSRRPAESMPDTAKRPPSKRPARSLSVRSPFKKKKAAKKDERTTIESSTPKKEKSASVSAAAPEHKPSNKRKPEPSKSPERKPKIPRRITRQSSKTLLTDAKPPKGRVRPFSNSDRTPQKQTSRSAEPSPAKKRLTLPPFGHVLEQALTPKKKNKENQSMET